MGWVGWIAEFIFETSTAIMVWFWGRMSGAFGVLITVTSLILWVFWDYIVELGYWLARTVILFFPATGPTIVVTQFQDTPFFVVVSVFATLIDVPFVLQAVGVLFVIQNVLFFVAAIRWIKGLFIA